MILLMSIPAGYDTLLEELNSSRPLAFERLSQSKQSWYNWESLFRQGKIINIPEGEVPEKYRQEWIGVRLHSLVKVPEDLLIAGIVTRKPVENRDQEFFGSLTPDALIGLLKRRTKPAIAAVRFYLTLNLSEVLMFRASELEIKGKGRRFF